MLPPPLYDDDFFVKIVHNVFVLARHLKQIFNGTIVIGTDANACVGLSYHENVCGICGL